MARQYFPAAIRVCGWLSLSLVSGCASAPPVRAPAGDSTPSRSHSKGVPAASESGLFTSVPHDAEPLTAPTGPSEAAIIGTAALTAYCRPSADYETWIGELYPFLSQAAGAAYETVDPANVPCTTVTGDAAVRDGADPYTVGIAVPTDAGDYEVYLHRTGEHSPWAVEQITPVSAD